MFSFLKLGGSLITDKASAETSRPDVIKRVADEVSQALRDHPDIKLLIGHGSGSFGHSVAREYSTQSGVRSKADWRGFSHVATVASALNHEILTQLFEAGIPVFRIQPSASVISKSGKIIQMATEPIERALANGLVPLVYGDVAMDDSLGGTITSTETIFSYLAAILRPAQILLAGDYEGVWDAAGNVIPLITPPTLAAISDALGASEHPDVTGGMLSKTQMMLDLCQMVDGLEALIFSGAQPGQIASALTGQDVGGTKISAR
jgi:isopentenyl phosphate kinase